MDSIINLRLFRQRAIYSSPLDELYSAEPRGRSNVKLITKMVGEGLVVDAGIQQNDQGPAEIEGSVIAKKSLVPTVPNSSADATKRRFNHSKFNRSVDKELADAVKQSRQRVYLAKAGQQMKCAALSEDEFLEWAVRISSAS